MNKKHLLAAGLAAGAALALPFAISAQDTRALGPGFYAIAVDRDGGGAWRVNTANGSVSLCRAPDASVAPKCSPWSSTILTAPRRRP